MKPGWRSPITLRRFRRNRDFIALVNELGLTYGAEIGVKHGRFTQALAGGIVGARILAVDPFEDYGEDEIRRSRKLFAQYEATARARVADHDVTFLKARSLDAAQTIPEGSLDFVHIDGNHTFDYAMRDLIEWSRRVRSGGIVSVHDYFHWDRGGVVAAVQAYTQAHGIDPWFVTPEDYPTAFWVKP